MATSTRAKERMICVESHTNSQVPGEVVLLRQEFDADHPAVKVAPRYFMPVGTPEEDWPSPFDVAIAKNAEDARIAEQERKERFQRAAKANPVKIEPPALVKAKRDLVCEFDGHPATIQKGSQLPADHPVVVEHPEMFAA